MRERASVHLVVFLMAAVAASSCTTAPEADDVVARGNGDVLATGPDGETYFVSEGFGVQEVMADELPCYEAEFERSELELADLGAQTIPVANSGLRCDDPDTSTTWIDREDGGEVGIGRNRLTIPPGVLSESCWASVSTDQFTSTARPGGDSMSFDGTDYHIHCDWEGEVEVATGVDRSVLMGPDAGYYVLHSQPDGSMDFEQAVLDPDGKSATVTTSSLSEFSEGFQCAREFSLWECWDARSAKNQALGWEREVADIADSRIPVDYWLVGLPDAARHCYWSALMTNWLGWDVAARILEIHEDSREQISEMDRRMDEFNNAIGQAIGEQSPDRIRDTCNERVNGTNGFLWIYLHPKGGATECAPEYLVRTDQLYELEEIARDTFGSRDGRIPGGRLCAEEPAPTTTAEPADARQGGTISASGRQDGCEFGPNCLIASFSISGYSPHPGSYTCVFSDGFRRSYEFGSNNVTTACYTAAAGDWIEIEINGERSNRVNWPDSPTATAPPTTAAPPSTLPATTTIQPPETVPATTAPPTTAAPRNGSISASGRQGGCEFGSSCLIAGFTISGFSPHPGSYTCVFSDGVRASFAFSGSSVNTACYTAVAGDWIEIEINGKRSNRISWPAPATTAPPVVTISASGRRGACEFGSSCLIAGFTISGFSPHPGSYTCVFSDGFRASFAFSGSSVNTACYTAAAGDWIEIEINGKRSNRVS